MASEGPLSAGTGANNADAGDSNWSSPGNIVSSNNSRATASTAGSDTWHTIQMIKGGSRSGSNLSSGAALPGADAYVTFGTSTQLWGLSWTDSDINASNFGVAIRCNIGSGFTTQYLHATNFGFAIPGGATIDGIVVEIEARTSGAPEIDHVRITVYYTAGGGGAGQPTSRRFGLSKHFGAPLEIGREGTQFFRHQQSPLILPAPKELYLG